MSYILNEDDIYAFARDYADGEYRLDGKELYFKYCPYCNGGNHADKETFSINLDSGAFCCFRASCNQHGHFVELARDFKFHLDGIDSKPREYKVLPRREIETKQAAIDYMASRGISEAVTRRYKITVKKSDSAILVFPFCDEYGDIRFIKYRKTNFVKGIDKNKEWSETGMQPYPFGVYQCDNPEKSEDKTLIITEGQIDSLSVAEAGFKNVVSVPTGANGFTWLDVDSTYDWLHKFERLIVFGDYEKGEITLLAELNKRVQIPLYHVRPEDYLGEKDANDILRKYGKEAVAKAVNNAVKCDTPHIKSLSDVKQIDLTDRPKIRTGITGLDKVIGGLYLGTLTVVSGKRGMGKSTFTSQCCVEALEQNYGFFAYSGELTDYFFKSWIDSQIAGGKNMITEHDEYGSESYRLPEYAAKKINLWYRDRAFLYDNTTVDENDEMAGVIAVAEQAIRRYSVKLICIDNLMTAVSTDPKLDLYRAQSIIAKSLASLARKYNVAIILVAHPRKSNGDFDNDTVSGSADITNAADLVINYERVVREDADSIITVTKNRLTGKLIKSDNPVLLRYSDKSKRISDSSKDPDSKVYGAFAAEDDDYPEEFMT